MRFSAPAGAALAPNSIFAFLHHQRDRLFPDDLFSDLFALVGRRSVPPSVVATVMVLQRLEGCRTAKPWTGSRSMSDVLGGGTAAGAPLAAAGQFLEQMGDAIIRFAEERVSEGHGERVFPLNSAG